MHGHLDDSHAMLDPDPAIRSDGRGRGRSRGRVLGLEGDAEGAELERPASVGAEAAVVEEVRLRRLAGVSLCIA